MLHMHRGDFFVFYENKINKIFSRLIFKMVSKIIVLSPSQVIPFQQLFPKKIEILPNSLPEEYIFGDKLFKNGNFVSYQIIFLKRVFWICSSFQRNQL